MMMMMTAESRRRRRRKQTEMVELGFFWVFFFLLWARAEPKCARTCGAAASFYVTTNENLSYIAQLFSIQDRKTILPYNPQVSNEDSIIAGSRLKVPFSCDCLNDSILAHNFSYTTVNGDTYSKISNTTFKNLTTVEDLRNFNSYTDSTIPVNAQLNVPVRCYCGNSSISMEYGFFLTYPLRSDDNITDVLAQLDAPSIELVQRYNEGKNLNSGQGLVFIPIRDSNNSTRPLSSKSPGISAGVIAGISIAVVAAVLFLVLCLYFGAFRRKKLKKASLLPSAFEDSSIQAGQGFARNLDGTTESATLVGGASPGITGITVDKSVEFSYEELAKATDDFSLANKIGEGGFGAVYYAELRGEASFLVPRTTDFLEGIPRMRIILQITEPEKGFRNNPFNLDTDYHLFPNQKAAIKKMDMQATKEFLAELKVLTHVHHLNLVRLIGYCTEKSLFLVYEFIENGNLSQHLRGSGREPLPWSTRVQIALDSARGLEYIHEHTVPVYIHRDIKSANILIDKNFHAKVADFGLTKLTEVGSTSLQTRLVGTFGYMPPEYAQFGDVSPKVDVYAFGVVLYELISAKEAVVKTGVVIKSDGSNAESKGLVALFEGVLNESDPREDLRKLVDARLGDNYPIDAAHKMAQLAKACTQENPQLRPSMRSIVVALMTLSSSTEDWDVGSFYENQALVNLMSGR